MDATVLALADEVRALRETIDRVRTVATFAKQYDAVLSNPAASDAFIAGYRQAGADILSALDWRNDHQGQA